MTAGIVDTSVIVHLFRRVQPAHDWISRQPEILAVTPITWLEVLYGAGSKEEMSRCRSLLEPFALIYLTNSDMDWAISRMETLRLKHGVGMSDCLIASVAYRLQVPLYTHNLKDMTPLIGSLAVKPYD